MVQRSRLPRRGAKLAGVNKINWGRVLAPIVYYFTAGPAMGAFGPGKVSFTVLQDNFRAILGGLSRVKWGLPIAIWSSPQTERTFARLPDPGRIPTRARSMPRSGRRWIFSVSSTNLNARCNLPMGRDSTRSHP